jgi:23S rRNA (pseudouridine1915-N3)-methyltransferase
LLRFEKFKPPGFKPGGFFVYSSITMTGKPQITLLCVGKLKETFWKDAEAEYLKRLQSYTTKIRVIEILDEPTPENASAATEAQIREREGEKLLGKLAKLTERAYVIVLDSQGKSFDSVAFATHLESVLLSYSEIVFIIGGSLGLSESVKEKAHLILSFGKFTLPHQLMRVVLLEQIFRAGKIGRGENYHK